MINKYIGSPAQKIWLKKYNKYNKYIGSSAWKRRRKAVLERSKGMCECEGECSNTIDDIHHLVYPEKLGTESIDTLQGLCKNCHGARHDKLSVLKFNPCCKRIYV